jgi:hypothetical protein
VEITEFFVCHAHSVVLFRRLLVAGSSTGLSTSALPAASFLKPIASDDNLLTPVQGDTISVSFDLSVVYSL